MFSLETASIIGAITLAASLWAIAKILYSEEGRTVKTLWIATVVLLPLLGFVFWYFVGPREQISHHP
ncbi:PLD nuclease N-terminal domain-containing protein [Kiloniella laminariae]|uniref:PLD nuclease N-terminal domain-containing protein n=1 Tax=Kiloniella laminariae TaxID=454162 RepID=A0ABT4LGV7_9PROT|nr:PLD nuclease N-terminal domain-containing protein [Kiloniella laminariae]MCZ4280341.1 PLD nuclease N-terminal domain-containing protein [Kiloniella laminariae]